MNDQEIEKQQQPLKNEQELIPTEASIHNQTTMEALDPIAAPFPTLSAYGNSTPLKRRSPSSSFCPPLQTPDSDAGKSQMLSEGGNERTSTTPHPLCRCSSLSSTNSNFLNPPPENHTRRPLFPSPAMPFSYLENPILPRGYLGSVSRFDSTHEIASSKRMKRIQIHRIRQQMNQLIDEMANQEGLIERIDPIPDTEIVQANDKVLNCHGGSKEVEEGTVTAERIGDCTHLEFKCRCGSGYSVRITGHDFFYKLI